MKSLQQLAAAGLLAGLGAAAFAQAQPQAMPMQPGQPPMMMEHDRMNPQMMQERMNRRFAALKQQLQVTPAQDAAFNQWQQAMRPTGQRPQRPNFVEFARMTTPQRIDRLRELRAQRNAEQDRRADATKAFYAQLNPQQQKTFDEQSFGFMGRGGRRHGGGEGHWGHGR
jgi:hypothetical protein